MDNINTLIQANRDMYEQISVLKREMDQLQTQIYKNNDTLRSICQHTWERDPFTQDFTTVFICKDCGIYR